MSENLLYFLLIYFVHGSSFHPEVTVGRTTYRGITIGAWKENEIYSFQGIRYAEPPIGNLRFKDPVPLKEPLEGTVDVFTYGYDCPSLIAKNSSEDCLFLNIFTRKLPSKPDELKPVIAFIHPGGLYIGTSRSSVFGPKYLLEEPNDIVLITFNYRLGALGFLNLGTEEIPGNAGFKDQVLALRWIKENIVNFGGNPNLITIMGYSAGALSVHLHLVSPMSKGLFHRAIIMSGSLPPQTELGSDQLELAKRQCQVLNCSAVEEELSDVNKILNCLNQFDGVDIAKTTREMFYFGKDNPIYLWFPVIENDYGQERFLTKSPYKIFQEGNFSKVPVLMGFTSNEFCTSAVDIIKDDKLLQTFKENFTEIFPICFMYSRAEKNKLKSELIRQFYFNEKDFLSKENILRGCEAFSDSVIRFGLIRSAEIMSKFVDVFLYKFSYVGRYSTLYYPGPNDILGAEHTDDLMYIFENNEKASFKPSDPERGTIEMMTSLITNFSRNGFLGKSKEEKSCAFQKNEYCDIGSDLKVKTGNYFDNYNFWNDLFNDGD